MAKNKLLCILILFMINLLNYMDRYSVAGVLTLIQNYFDINDAQGGLLQTVFIASFMVFAPISGFLGDRYSRKWIIAIGLVVWVGAVLASTFVPKETFWLFILLRGVVGIGEASYSILAPTLIADLFVASSRSNALMFFYFAIPVGSGLGYVIGSSVSSAFSSWKWGIRVTPLLGLISIIALVLFIDEPERGEAERLANGGMQKEAPSKCESTYLDDLKYLCKIKTYLWSTVGYTAVVFVTGTLAWWAPAAIDHAMAMKEKLSDSSELDPNTKDKVAVMFGAITVLGGITGVSSGTYLSHMWKEGKFCFRNCASSRADPLISAFGALAAVPLLFAAFLLIHTNLAFAWVAIFFSVTFVSLNCAINVDMLLYIIVPHRRAIASSWQITLSHLFGDASGPYIVGLISDWIRGSETSPSSHFYSLLYAFYAPNVILIVSGVAFLICAFTLPHDINNYKYEMEAGKRSNGNHAADLTRIGAEAPLSIVNGRQFGDFTSV